MNIQIKILFLACLSLLSILVGFSVFVKTLQREHIERQTIRYQGTINDITNFIRSYLETNLKTIYPLSALPSISKCLQHSSNKINREDLNECNIILDLFKQQLSVDVVYLMDKSGLTIASSNIKEKDSFVGKNYSFRPYFKNAIDGEKGSIYLALGTTSNKRGIYYSTPIKRSSSTNQLTQIDFMGVVAIKNEITPLIDFFKIFSNDFIFLLSPESVIFISNVDKFNFTSLDQIDSIKKEAIKLSKQFGQEDIKWSKFKKNIQDDFYYLESEPNKRFRYYEKSIPYLTNWKLVLLSSEENFSFKMTSLYIFFLFIFVLLGISSIFIYRSSISQLGNDKRKIEDEIEEKQKSLQLKVKELDSEKQNSIEILKELEISKMVERSASLPNFFMNKDIEIYNHQLNFSFHSRSYFFYKLLTDDGPILIINFTCKTHHKNTHSLEIIGQSAIDKINNYLKTKILNSITPGEIITILNSHFFHFGKSSVFVTTFVGIIDLFLKEIIYINASYPFPILTSSCDIKKSDSSFNLHKEVQLLNSNTSPLGLNNEITYSLDRINYNSLDLLTIYSSDFIVQSIAGNGLYYDEQHFQKTLKENCTLPIPILAIKIIEDRFSKLGNIKSNDDLLLTFLELK